MINEMAVSSAGDITYFYEFDLKNCDKRPWQRRMESLERRGELMIEYSNMQLSPNGRWLAAQVSKYVAATGGCAPAPVITRNGDNQPFREQPNVHRSTTQFVSTPSVVPRHKMPMIKWLHRPFQMKYQSLRPIVCCWRTYPKAFMRTSFS